MAAYRLLAAITRVLGEPGLDWRLIRSLAMTLARGTCWMGTAVMELAGASAVTCCMMHDVTSKNQVTYALAMISIRQSYKRVHVLGSGSVSRAVS